MGSSSQPPDDATAAKLERLGIVDSHGIDLDVPAISHPERPVVVSHLSSPAYKSPLRHHRRASSRNRQVKETLDAKTSWASESDDQGPSIHKINQYTLKQEIGRGSFGCVLLAEDQYGNEFAVKEFSKSRLRKRAQSNLLRRPSKRKPAPGFVSVASSRDFLLGQRSSSRSETDANNDFDLIKGEIAVMKNLDHPNLVSLIEVLDDPHEDSLYMVLEMCKKGVVMKVGLEETADPYEEETCRYWFRDLLLGLEYLHHQGIIHRDLKPDNCLITQDDVLKIVDFGVSEMFDKSSDMSTSKSAGSPAFMPPELCVAKHGNVSGRAVDIWSMGVTLYCLRYGKIPFEKQNMLELYEAIRSDEPYISEDENEQFRDLILQLLQKDPKKRIVMKDIREHPWVTKNGEDPLLSEEENCNHIVDEPTDAEVNAAITGNMGRLLAVAKAVKRFKGLLKRRRPELLDGILGHSSRFVAPPATLGHGYSYHSSRSQDTFNRRPIEGILAAEGVHHEMNVSESDNVTPQSAEPTPALSRVPTESLGSPHTSTSRHQSQSPSMHQTGSRNLSPDESGRGHAHDPLLDTLFLSVGAGPSASEEPEPGEVCESPGAVEENIYEKAYEEEMERIISQRGKSATMYLSRRVDHKHELRQKEGVVDFRRNTTGGGGGFAGLVRRAAEKAKESGAEEETKAKDTDENKDQ